jgi:hypothetical protein
MRKPPPTRSGAPSGPHWVRACRESGPRPVSLYACTCDCLPGHHGGSEASEAAPQHSSQQRTVPKCGCGLGEGKGGARMRGVYAEGAHRGALPSGAHNVAFLAGSYPAHEGVTGQLGGGSAHSAQATHWCATGMLQLGYKRGRGPGSSVVISVGRAHPQAPACTATQTDTRSRMWWGRLRACLPAHRYSMVASLCRRQNSPSRFMSRQATSWCLKGRRVTGGALRGLACNALRG